MSVLFRQNVRTFLVKCPYFFSKMSEPFFKGLNVNSPAKKNLWFFVCRSKLHVLDAAS